MEFMNARQLSKQDERKEECKCNKSLRKGSGQGREVVSMGEEREE
jgi:hypothetical protein